MNNINKISIIYNIKKNEEEIRIFGEEFVKNNNENCTVMIDNKEYNITENFKIKNYNVTQFC